MAAITTRETGTTGVNGVTRKNAPLTNAEIDNNFVSLNDNKYESGNSPTFTDTTITGRLAATRVDQNVSAVAALNIDCSLGNYFTKTINGASTFTVSNVPAGRSYALTVRVIHTSGTIAWWSGVVWPENIAPVLLTGRTHLFIFITDDGGTTWRGAFLPNYTA